jgi:arsenate reductase
VGDFPVTVFHNPACGTSRNVLAAIREAGHEPEVVQYLKAGWTGDELRDLFAAAGLTPREALRVKGTRAEELGLTAPEATDDQILQAMLAEPILVNRPIVRTPKGTMLVRPSERVREIL